jgi:hypothetical protein
MTIAGCIVGYILVQIFGEPQWLIISCLLIGIFGMAYFFVVSYAWAMFCVGLVVVAMFSYLGGWTLELLWQRTYETALGCAVATLSSALFMPVYSRQKFQQELPRVMQCCANFLRDIIATANQHQVSESNKNAEHLNALFTQIKSLEKDYSMAKFEMIILFKSSHTMDEFLPKLIVGFHYMSSLSGVLRVLANQAIYQNFEVELNNLWGHLQAQFARTILAINTPAEPMPLWENTAARTQLREKFYTAKQQQLFTPDEMMHLTASVYYGRMLDRVLHEMIAILISHNTTLR